MADRWGSLYRSDTEREAADPTRDGADDSDTSRTSVLIVPSVIGFGLVIAGRFSICVK